MLDLNTHLFRAQLTPMFLTQGVSSIALDYLLSFKPARATKSGAARLG